jgi:Amidohydrolase
MMPIRWAQRATELSWVTMTSVRPWSRQSSSSNLMLSSRVPSSRFPVGSSASGKLSGVHSSPTRASDLRPDYETVLAAFAPGRLTFGSDWPVSARVASYSQVCDMYRELTGQLSAAEQDAIFDRTARRVYRLPGPESPRQDKP